MFSWIMIDELTVSIPINLLFIFAFISYRFYFYFLNKILADFATSYQCHLFDQFYTPLKSHFAQVAPSIRWNGVLCIPSWKGMIFIFSNTFTVNFRIILKHIKCLTKLSWCRQFHYSWYAISPHFTNAFGINSPLSLLINTIIIS